MKDVDTVNATIWPHITTDLTGYRKPRMGQIDRLPPAGQELLNKALEDRSATVDTPAKLGLSVQVSSADSLPISASLTAC